MTNVFDPATYMTMTVDQEGSTKAVPIPVGDYTAVISEPKTRTWQGRADPSKSGIALDITYDLELPEAVKAELGRDKATVTQGIMLDLLENGGLDMGKGKNLQLNRLREACDLNRAGVPFNFMMFQGRVVTVKIGHRLGDNGDVYTDVKAVARMGQPTA